MARTCSTCNAAGACSTCSAAGACRTCLARVWLLGRLSGNLEMERHRIDSLLELGDEELIEAVGGAQRDDLRCELRAFDADRARERCAVAGLEPICRCTPAYPRRLAALAAPPAVLHVAGGLARFLVLLAEEPVAIVGARRASPYGIDVARSLGRGLGSCAVTVLSGMALGVDTAAHRGAIDAEAATVAVLPGAAERSYPASARSLHRKIQERGSIVSELPPGTPVRRWMFPARNRIIAGLSAMTVVVEARAGSGALLTAGFAAELGRAVGAVPGRITSALACGPHELLRAGALLVSGPQDVLDGLFGAQAARAPGAARPKLAPHLQALLDALAAGHELHAALAQAGLSADRGLAALASLELEGRVRRQPGGRFTVPP